MNPKRNGNLSDSVTKSVTVTSVVTHPLPTALEGIIRDCPPVRLVELGDWLEVLARNSENAGGKLSEVGKREASQIHRSLAEIKRSWADQLRALAKAQVALAPAPPSGVGLN